MIRYHAFAIASLLAVATVSSPSGASSLNRFVASDGKTPIIETLTGDTLTAQVGSTPSTRGSGVAATKQIPLGSVTEVVVLVGAHVEAVSGSTDQRATLTTDDNLQDAIGFTVSGNVLTIAATRSFVAKRPQIKLALARIASLKSHATDEIRVSGLSGDAFAIDAGGTGAISASGNVSSVTVLSTGSAYTDISKLRASHVALVSRGSGDTLLSRSADTSVRIDGAGSVFIPGDATTVSRAGNGSGRLVVIPPS